METFSIKVITKETGPDNVLFLGFEKPIGFAYLAGQFVELRIKGNREWYSFTLASAPKENHLLIVTRIRDTDFKKQLNLIEPGGIVEITGPWGNFVLPTLLPRHVVFLAGGLGVNVFRSMLVEESELDQDIFLFVSSSSENSILYDSEFRTMTNITYVPTVTRGTSGKWEGERGRISGEMLARYGVEQKDTMFFIVGSSDFVSSMVTQVKSLGASMDQIRIEQFSGY